MYVNLNEPVLRVCPLLVWLTLTLTLNLNYNCNLTPDGKPDGKKEQFESELNQIAGSFEFKFKLFDETKRMPAMSDICIYSSSTPSGRHTKNWNDTEK
jgi:hypothetical protein